MSDIGWGSLESIEETFQKSKKTYRSFRNIEPGYHHAEIQDVVVDMSDKGIKIEWLLDVNGTGLRKWSYITNNPSSALVFLAEMSVIGLDIVTLLKLKDSDFDSVIGKKVLVEVKDKPENEKTYKTTEFIRLLN